MRRSILLTVIGLAALATAPPCSLASESPVRPGARGVVRTVLSGDRITEIPLEVLGVLESATGPGRDLVLIRLEGPEARRVGVAAGMSGSPVYVDGDLLGALSYRLGFLPTEPVAGVTPIEDMRAAGKAVSGHDAASPVEPIATPVFVSGVAGPVMELLREELQSYGLLVVAGAGGSGREPAEPRTLLPGSPVGAQLVRGDLGVVATGTVTWVEEDRVFAFGHPFVGAGRVEVPMVNADVVHTLAALGGSLKLANAGAEVGAFVDDRLTGVVGQLERRARMIPVHLRVDGGDHESQSFAFEVVRRSPLAPVLAGVVVANALVLNVGFDQEATVRAEGRIRFDGLEDLPVEVAVASGGLVHPFLRLAFRVQQYMDALYRNPFRRPEVVGIELRARVRRDRRQYEVESVHFDRTPLEPGQVVEIHCLLRSFRGRTESVKLTVPVPDSLVAGEALRLAVGSASAVDRVLGRPLAYRLATASSLEKYVQVLGTLPAEDRLRAALYRAGQGVVVEGEAFTRLPPTAARLLASGSDGSAARLRFAPVARAERRLDGPLEGVVVESVEVNSRKRSSKDSQDASEERP